jgi:GT2 family glycosyltransferase
MINDIMISYVIVNWNNGDLLSRCIDSLLKQKNISKEIILIDNNSTDESHEIIQGFPSSVNVILNDKNLGYSGGANQGIDISNGKYISIINPDILLDENYGSIIVEYLENNEKVGAVTGKLIKYDFPNSYSLNVLDSTGIQVNNALNMIDRGQNDTDLAKYDDLNKVFGVSGAAPIYRKKALKDICIDNEYFDVDFLAYKEDIDLSWRLRNNGWEIIFLPHAIAHHGRAIGADKSNLKNFIKNRKKQSQFIRKISLRNHYCLILKNLRFRDLKEVNIKFVLQEVKRILYSILFEPKTLLGLYDFIKLAPKMLNKRKKIKIKSKGRLSTVFFIR